LETFIGGSMDKERITGELMGEEGEIARRVI
jgi:hypothetical protein